MSFENRLKDHSQRQIFACNQDTWRELVMMLITWKKKYLSTDSFVLVIQSNKQGKGLTGGSDLDKLKLEKTRSRGISRNQDSFLLQYLEKKKNNINYLS